MSRIGASASSCLRRFMGRVRNKLLGEIGLSEVREFRLKQLARERDVWRAQISAQRNILPELNPILILSVT